MAGDYSPSARGGKVNGWFSAFSVEVPTLRGFLLIETRVNTSPLAYNLAIEGARQFGSTRSRIVAERREVNMRRLICGVLFVFLSIFIVNTTPPTKAQSAGESNAEPQSNLPVKRVALYKNGVGYFEHSARVRGAQDLNIDFTTGQLNDVLKSLTVVDLGGGRITGVRFNSVAPPEERLRTLRLPLEEDTSRADLLNALRGTRVFIKSGSETASGRVLSVETHRRPTGKQDQVAEVLELSLVADNGELRTFELEPGTTVRIADNEIRDDVASYLDLIGSTKAMDLRRMTISAAGSGERDLFVSYISEVPVWKSTYRILLPAKSGEKPLLQGWAIVDNTIGEDWNDVRLSLVAGAPQSFVQDISLPYYVHRPVVGLPESVTLAPQTHEAGMAKAVAPPPPGAGPGIGPGQGGGFGGGTFTVGPAGTAGLQGTVVDSSGAVIPGATVTVRNEATGATRTTRTDPQGHYSFYNLPPGNSALFVQFTGFQRYALTNIFLGTGRVNEINPTLEVGNVTQAIEVTAEPVELQTQSPDIAAEAGRQVPEAEGRIVGEQFEYDIKDKVTIGKNQSALVPILQARIEAEKVTLWNEEFKTPRRALWLANTSGMTLDAGTVNILDAETFAGEGLLDAIRPGEKRLVSYAADTAVRVSSKEDSSEEPVSRVRINKGLMLMTREDKQTTTYRIYNADDSSREVIIEHPARGKWELSGDLKPEETSASFHRFRVKVQPKESAELVVKEHRPYTMQIALEDLSDDHVKFLTEQKRMTPELEKTFRRILDQNNLIAGLDAQLRDRDQEIKAIGTDQARVRENMKALKGTAEEKALLQRYVRQLDAQEDRLAALRSQVSEIKAKRDQASDQLDEFMDQVTLDQTF
jgi:hypothetical protein